MDTSTLLPLALVLLAVLVVFAIIRMALRGVARLAGIALIVALGGSGAYGLTHDSTPTPGPGIHRPAGDTQPEQEAEAPPHEGGGNSIDDVVGNVLRGVDEEIQKRRDK